MQWDTCCGRKHAAQSPTFHFVAYQACNRQLSMAQWMRLRSGFGGAVKKTPPKTLCPYHTRLDPFSQEKSPL